MAYFIHAYEIARNCLKVFVKLGFREINDEFLAINADNMIFTQWRTHDILRNILIFSIFIQKKN